MSAPSIEALTAKGSPNTPAQWANLRLLQKFLGDLPFEYTITSAYRTSAHNAAIGGSSTSQHPNGLAVDLVPQGLTNRELATWLWVNRNQYPELDQVIWYTSTNHVHIGICPPKAEGCVAGAPRKSFLAAGSEGSGYSSWSPSSEEIASISSRFPFGRPWPWLLIGAGVAAAATLGIGLYIFTRGR